MKGLIIRLKIALMIETNKTEDPCNSELNCSFKTFFFPSLSTLH